MKSVLAAALCAVLLSACATPATRGPVVAAGATQAEEKRQAEYVVERRAADYKRVYDIAHRVRAANADACPTTAPWTGVAFETLYDHRTELRAAAKSVLALSAEPQAMWIAEGSPAAAAGVRLGDVVLAVNGEAVPSGAKASRAAAKMIRDAAEKGPVRLGLDRAGERLELTVAPGRTCGYDVRMIDDGSANAHADGDEIVIYRGLLKHVENDEELALVFAHELAHNAMGHLDKAGANALAGALGGALVDIALAAGGVNTGGAFAELGGDVGRRAWSRAFEAEADYVGVYYLARAGYDLDGVEAFWRRMSAENPRAIRLATTHPSHAERYVKIAAARDEIAAKRAAGRPLQPELKSASKP